MTKKSQKPAGSKAVPEKQKPKVWNVPSLVAVAIFTITFISFYPSLECDFTNWDDDTYVTASSLITSQSVVPFFITPVALNYHPLTMLTLAWNYRVSQLDPQSYHIINLLIHLLNTLLVFYLIYLLSEKKVRVAAVTSLLFGIHPMHVESVTWVSERKDVVYVFFYLLSLITYLRYLETRKVAVFILCFLLFILSCLSKAMAVVLPVVLLLIDHFKDRKISIRTIAEKIPFFIVSVIFGIVALKIQSGSADAAIQSFTPPQRIIFGCYGLLVYVIKFVLPVRLSAFYPYPIQDGNENIPVIYFAAPFVVLISAFLVYRFFWHQKFVVFGLLFFITTIILVLQFISVGNALMADRYSYLSYTGLAVIAGFLYENISSRYPAYNTGINILLTLIAVWFCFLTYQRTMVWRNSETLWTDVIGKYPAIEVGYKNRGSFFAEQGKFNEALKDYEILMKMNSNDPEVYNNLGNIYASQNKIDASLNASTKAISLKPDFYNAYLNRGITYNSISRFDKGIADFTAAISIEPNRAQPYALRGFANYSTGNFKDAVNDFSRAVNIEPTNAAAYYYRGLSYYNLDKTADAASDLQKAKAYGYQVDYSVMDKPGKQ